MSDPLPQATRPPTPAPSPAKAPPHHRLRRAGCGCLAVLALVVGLWLVWWLAQRAQVEHALSASFPEFCSHPNVFPDSAGHNPLETYASLAFPQAWSVECTGTPGWTPEIVVSLTDCSVRPPGIIGLAGEDFFFRDHFMDVHKLPVCP